MALRRIKTYTGGQGYVYEYYFVGKRLALSQDFPEPATQFVFDVSPNAKTKFAVSIFLPDAIVASWGTRHSRALSDAEQYGAVKMRLFRAFDEIEDMIANGRKLYIDLEGLEQLLVDLGVE